MELDYDQYRIIVESSPNMIWRSGKDGLCDYFNTTWLEFTGKAIEQEVGSGWADGVHLEDYEICLKTYLDAFAKQEPFEMEYRLLRNDGAWRWINDRGVPYYVDNREFAGYIGSCMDVTDTVEGRKIWELGQKDGLTGVYSRQFFEQLANVEFLKAKRYHANLCFAMIDINHFKRINDNHGHHAGDLVLKEVAKTIISAIREFDIFGRFGGDEFILLMPNTNYTEATTLMKRLDNLIRNIELQYDRNVIDVSASFGAYQMINEDSLEKVIIEADKKLYQQKGAFKYPF